MCSLSYCETYYVLFMPINEICFFNQKIAKTYLRLAGLFEKKIVYRTDEYES